MLDNSIKVYEEKLERFRIAKSVCEEKNISTPDEILNDINVLELSEHIVRCTKNLIRFAQESEKDSIRLCDITCQFLNTQQLTNDEKEVIGKFKYNTQERMGELERILKSNRFSHLR
jgi:hypothetical protein